MLPATAYCVVGVRADGTEAVRLYSNSANRARRLAAFLRWQEGPLNVTIETLGASGFSGVRSDDTPRPRLRNRLA